MPVRVLRHAAVAVLLLAAGRATVTGTSAFGREEFPAVRLELADSTTAPVTGLLESITADAILLGGGARPRVPVADVRRLEVVTAAADAGPAAVVLHLTDGGRLIGRGFTAEDDTARLARDEPGSDEPGSDEPGSDEPGSGEPGSGEPGSDEPGSGGTDAAAGTATAVLPLDLVQLVSWPRPNEDPGEPAWLAALPDRPESDLVVVRKGDDFECVECAIVSVGDDAVTVLLDGDRIPVNLDRVAGLRWLRPTTKPAGRTRIDVTGGRLTADAVAWSPSGLVLDDRVTLPASWLRAVDYAAGRTVRLVDLEPEKTVVEPFVAGANAVPEIRGFFAPRFVSDANGGEPALLLRPRTVAVWRVPPGSRRFRTIVQQEGSRPGRTVVTLALDDREVFRHEPSATAAAVPLDVDVTGGRRLTVTVDFAGGLGGPVRLAHPAFEK